MRLFFSLPTSSMKIVQLHQSIRMMNNYPIYGLRFEINSTATGDRNKGRFCIDDIVFGLNKHDHEYVSYGYLSSY